MVTGWLVRNDQRTVGGPKWTKMDLFRPKWTKMDDFGPCWSRELLNPVQTKAILAKIVVMTILDHVGPVHMWQHHANYRYRIALPEELTSITETDLWECLHQCWCKILVEILFSTALVMFKVPPQIPLCQPNRCGNVCFPKISTES